MDSHPLSAQSAPRRRTPRDGLPGTHRPLPAGRPGGHGAAEKPKQPAPPGPRQPGGSVRKGQFRLCKRRRRQRRRDLRICPQCLRRVERGGRFRLRTPFGLLPGLCRGALCRRGHPRIDGGAGASGGTAVLGAGTCGYRRDRPQPLLRRGLGPDSRDSREQRLCVGRRGAYAPAGPEDLPQGGLLPDGR